MLQETGPGVSPDSREAEAAYRRARETRPGTDGVFDKLAATRERLPLRLHEAGRLRARRGLDITGTAAPMGVR